MLGFFLFGCKKEQVPPAEQNHYQSEGNFLLFVVGDTLEAAYEYNLSTIQVNNDTLPILFESQTDGTGMQEYRIWKMQPNDDTLFWTYESSSYFVEDEININDLLFEYAPLPYDSTQFQIISSKLNTDIEQLWTKVSRLQIVKEYRNVSPDSKIGISRQVLYSYNEELSSSVPAEKYLIFFVKY
ncbi:hypothetical protein [Brumimicrobium salinarum]|uniref:hypothetical protein n=1 Tax=Brumimicrobium salinarum TaxID=2058658 RepID=UPI00196B2A06|nr:hypothetical protein [Brumimicrobium salinarum]